MRMRTPKGRRRHHRDLLTPVPLRRPRTPPAPPPRRVPPPSFRGFLTSSYAPPILPGPSTRIVLCEPVDEPTGRPKTEPAYGFSAAANTVCAAEVSGFTT